MESRQASPLDGKRSAENDDVLGKKRFTRRCVLGTIAGGLLAANGAIFLSRWSRNHKGTTLVINGPFSVGDYEPDTLGMEIPKAISFFSPDNIKFAAIVDQSVKLLFRLSVTSGYTKLNIESKVYGAEKRLFASARQDYAFPKQASQRVRFSMSTISCITEFDHIAYLSANAKISEISRVEWRVTPS